MTEEEDAAMRLRMVDLYKRDRAIKKGEVIQIKPSHKWGGCLAVVSDVKSWGCVAYVSIPHGDGIPPGQAYIRLEDGEFERLGVMVIFEPAGGA